MFSLLCLRPKILLLTKFDLKNENLVFKMKFQIINLNMLNLVVRMEIHFSVLDLKYHLWPNLMQKVKTIYLR